MNKKDNKYIVNIPGKELNQLHSVDFKFDKDVFKHHFSGVYIGFDQHYKLDAFLKKINNVQSWRTISKAAFLHFYFNYTDIARLENMRKRLKTNINKAVEITRQDPKKISQKDMDLVRELRAKSQILWQGIITMVLERRKAWQK